LVPNSSFKPQIEDMEAAIKDLKKINKKKAEVDKKKKDLNVEGNIFRSKNRLNNMLVKVKSPYQINEEGKILKSPPVQSQSTEASAVLCQTASSKRSAITATTVNS
jgi:hypothetical protein